MRKQVIVCKLAFTKNLSGNTKCHLRAKYCPWTVRETTETKEQESLLMFARVLSFFLLSHVAFVKEKRGDRLLPFFSSFLLIAACQGVMLRWAGPERCCHSLLPTFMLTELSKGLILRDTFLLRKFLLPEEQKRKSSNNIILVWTPNRRGPFKPEQQN